MLIERGKINDLKIITPKVFNDFRGEYVETFNEKIYEEEFNVHFVEDDISRSIFGVARGLHGDDKTWKLIQCIYGSIYVAVVDYRKNSSTYLTVDIFTVNDTNRKQILVPSGCANGHISLSNECIFSYKQSSYYSGANNQFTLKWNDDRFNIYLPLSKYNLILSERDRF